jgi:carbonic anhydrase
MMAREVIKEIIEGNDKYSTVLLEEIKKGQCPKVTLVTCSDSRVSGHIFNKDLVNYIFHIRNIGNQIENNFGSVDYGVHHLKTPILLILGHTDCGAIKASQVDFSAETDEIKKELYPLHFNMGLKKIDRNDPKFISRLVQHNIDIQVKEAVKRYSTDHTFVVGAVFDIHGHFNEKGCRMIITNINGITDEEELRNHPLLSALEASLIQTRVKRI